MIAALHIWYRIYRRIKSVSIPSGFSFFYFILMGKTNQTRKSTLLGPMQHADGRKIVYMWCWFSYWAAHKRVCYYMCWVWCIQKKRSINGRSIYIYQRREGGGCAGERAMLSAFSLFLSLFSVYNIQRQTPSSSFLFFFAAAGPSRMSIEDGKENRRNLYIPNGMAAAAHNVLYMLRGPSTASKTFR